VVRGRGGWGLPPPLYRTVRMALATFFEPVWSLVQLHPRTQDRSEPGAFSRPLQATSNTIRVLLVPSVMPAMVTPSGWEGMAVEPVAAGQSGNTPSLACPPWPL